MESRELIGVIRQELIQVEAQGGTQVGVPALRAYLDALEKHTEASQEHRRREHEGMLAQYEAKSQQSIEMLKAVLETGKSALHSLVIINGGAVIALLGVMSSLAGKPDGTLLADTSRYHYFSLVLEFFAAPWVLRSAISANHITRRLHATKTSLRYGATALGFWQYLRQWQVLSCLGLL